MSFYDLSKLSKEELIAQFVLESCQSSGSLAYHDYQIIDFWLEKAHGDADLVLLILSECLPKYVESSKANRAFFSLRGLKSKLGKKISEACEPL